MAAACIHNLSYAPTCPALHWSRHVHSPQLSSTGASASAALTLTCPMHRLLAQANAVYRNPILGGDQPDASPIPASVTEVLPHSLQLSTISRPAHLALHGSGELGSPSRPPASPIPASVWAPYLCEYEGRFYIYFPAITACAWSMPSIRSAPGAEPIDLGINAIDPAHIARERTPLPLRQRRRVWPS